MNHVTVSLDGTTVKTIATADYAQGAKIEIPVLQLQTATAQVVTLARQSSQNSQPDNRILNFCEVQVWGEWNIISFISQKILTHPDCNHNCWSTKQKLTLCIWPSYCCAFPRKHNRSMCCTFWSVFLWFCQFSTQYVLEDTTERTAQRNVVLDVRMRPVIHWLVTVSAETTGSLRRVKVKSAIKIKDLFTVPIVSYSQHQFRFPKEQL